MTDTTTHGRFPGFETRSVSPALGTEFLDIDLRKELSPELVDALRNAFFETGLILVRGQEELSYAEQERFASLFGSPTSRFPKGFLGPVPKSPEQYISNTRPEGYGREGRLLLHSDYCFDEQIVLGICLFGEVPPTEGGATIFVNARKAAEHLDESLQKRLESAEVRHVYDFDGVEEGFKKYDITDKAHVITKVRPALMAHPVTGETILYVNELMTDRFEGFTAEDSRALLGDVYAHLDQAAFRYDHTWSVGDIIVFDNIKLQHGRTHIPAGVRRSLRRLQFDADPSMVK